MLTKKPSKISGNGIFTDATIPQGEAFYHIPQNIISDKPQKRWARIGDKYFSDEKVLNYVNHSCEPNSCIDIEDFCLVAKRDIEKDEEITVDYDKTEIDGEQAACHCGSKNCGGYFLREL